jgi:hypothetical protein
MQEPATARLFVNDMHGPLYVVGEDGKGLTPYLDLSEEKWALRIHAYGPERGFQSFAFHPQFNEPGAPGFGKLYTYMDTRNSEPAPDFAAEGGEQTTHDTILLEWTAKVPGAAAYDGGPARELLRIEKPFANHNGGQIGFNTLAAPGTADFGMLYVGVADGGSGGDPLRLGQNLASGFGKMLRIDPLGTNSANGKYGIPADNPLVNDGDAGTLAEIYAWGLRNPQRFTWDTRNGNLFVADIGQNTVEEVSLVTKGANLGWNEWEGSFRYVNRVGVRLDQRRGDPTVTYPVVEYGQLDPLLQSNSAVTLGYVYRSNVIPQLANLLLFGDNPSGEVFSVNADALPQGGQDALRRVLFRDRGEPTTLLELIRQKNAAQGKAPAKRADLRFGLGREGQVFLLNKQDGTIRLLVPDAAARHTTP